LLTSVVGFAFRSAVMQTMPAHATAAMTAGRAPSAFGKRAPFAARSFRDYSLCPEYCGRAPLRRAANWEMELNAQATKLEAAENDLKQLMADVTRAIEKAQDAVARIASKAAAATTEKESTSR
jgi:hypothetical protein